MTTVGEPSNDRLMCYVRISETLVMLTCTNCSWTFRADSDDSEAGKTAFDAHRCQDFPGMIGEP